MINLPHASKGSLFTCLRFRETHHPAALIGLISSKNSDRIGPTKFQHLRLWFQEGRYHCCLVLKGKLFFLDLRVMLSEPSQCLRFAFLLLPSRYPLISSNSSCIMSTLDIVRRAIVRFNRVLLSTESILP
jgi:hypothetical protein